MTGRIKKAGKQREIGALALDVLASYQPIQWVDWYEATRARRGKGLGSTTFSKTVKELMADGRVQMNEGGYQGVFDVVGDDGGVSEAAGNSTTIETNCPSTVFSGAFRGASNGNAESPDDELIRSAMEMVVIKPTSGRPQ